MNRGAIIMIDALGFKGIWKRERPDRVLTLLKNLRRKGAILQGDDGSGVLVNDSGFRHRVRCMSDTIVITVIAKGRKEPDRPLYKAMYSAVFIAMDIIQEALRATPQLLFRGCIATGDMSESADFVIGPAVDEVASNFELADGPFLWLCESASDINRRYSDTFDERLEPTLMIPYSVPLKNRRRIDTHAFHYLCACKDKKAREHMESLVMSAFGPGPWTSNVARKRRNTKAFFKVVAEVAESGAWRRPRPTRRPDWNDLTSNQRMALIIRGILPDRYNEIA